MAFLGMRGTGDYSVPDQRPKNYRDTILMLYPNGTAPLTAMLAKLPSETTDDPEFKWFEKMLPHQAGDITGIFTDAACTMPYAAGGVAGDVLYVQVDQSVADEFRVGHQALIRDTADSLQDVNAKTISVVKNGASSVIGCQLLENAKSGTAACDRLLIIGNINSEGASIPDAVSYDPLSRYNLTQIFRTPLEITRTARRTKIRTGDAYSALKRDALEMHSIEMEKAFLFGVRTERIGPNGKPERTTGGLIQAIRQFGAVSDYTTDATTAGKTWTAGGKKWLSILLEQIFRYGKTEKLAFCGSGAILGMNELAEAFGDIQISTKQVDFGIKVTEWVTPFGTLYMKTHPLFSYEPTNRHTMMIFEPQGLKYRYIDDTTFFADDSKHGHARRDGVKEEFLTEAGLEYHFPIGWGLLEGIGKDHP